MATHAASRHYQSNITLCSFNIMTKKNILWHFFLSLILLANDKTCYLMYATGWKGRRPELTSCPLEHTSCQHVCLLPSVNIHTCLAVELQADDLSPNNIQHLFSVFFNHHSIPYNLTKVIISAKTNFNKTE